MTVLTNGAYAHDPHWYYNFLYEEERARGLDCEEDLAAPGVLSWNLADGKAALVLTTKEHASASLPANVKPVEWLNKLRDTELMRAREIPVPPASRGRRLYRSARGGKTIIAGYPWFTDWGRDINPARTAASAVPSGIWTGAWIYFAAPIFGMFLAAQIYRGISGVSPHACPKYPTARSSGASFVAILDMRKMRTSRAELAQVCFRACEFMLLSCE